jgi:hypothetical protein
MSTREALPFVAIVIAIVAMGYIAVRFNAQEATLQPADFRNAARAEIRDGDGAVVLSGTFMLVEEEDDDIERKAALTAAPGGDILGEAEVEFATEMPVDQEVEFAARGLAAGVTYTLVVDEQDVATVAADERGRIAVELDVPLPGATSFR